MEEKAKRIAKILVDSLKRRKGIFKEININKLNLFPKTTKKLLALFTLYTISIDYATRAEILFKKLKNLFNSNKDFFNPNFLLTLKQNEIARILREKVGIRFPNEAAKKWLEISRVLTEKYQSDARKIFENTNNALEVFQRVREIKGFGPKLAGIFLKFMIDFGFGKNLKNIEKIPMPVDVHLARLAFKFGLINKKDYKNFIPQISEIWSNAARNANVSWLELNDALWILGAYGCKNKKCKICPVKNFCKLGNAFYKLR